MLTPSDKSVKPQKSKTSVEWTQTNGYVCQLVHIHVFQICSRFIATCIKITPLAQRPSSPDPTGDITLCLYPCERLCQGGGSTYIWIAPPNSALMNFTQPQTCKLAPFVWYMNQKETQPSIPYFLNAQIFELGPGFRDVDVTRQQRKWGGVGSVWPSSLMFTIRRSCTNVCGVCHMCICVYPFVCMHKCMLTWAVLALPPPPLYCHTDDE